MSDAPDDEIERELRALSRELDAFRVPPPPRALLEATLARAKQELRAQVAARRVPIGFRRELAKLMVACAPPLAIVLAWNAFFLPRLAGYLDTLLPSAVAHWIALAYSGGALAWLALAGGLIPIAAHQRARLRASEAV
jgi:hypothetical protein